MRRITSRFVLLIASAAVAPLVVYGVVSIISLRNGTEQSVTRRQQRVADQVAEQIGQYIDAQHAGAQIGRPRAARHQSEQWQQTRVLKDYVLDFPEFREITFFTAGGRMIATSRAGDSDALASRSGERRHRRHLHRAARARRRQPAAHDDRRPRDAGGPGSRLGGRRNCARGTVAHGRSRPRRRARLRAARRRQQRFIAHGDPEQEATRGADAAAHAEQDAGAGIRGADARRQPDRSARADKLHGHRRPRDAGRRRRRPQPALGRHRRAADDEAFALADEPRSSSCSSPSASRCSAR